MEGFSKLQTPTNEIIKEKSQIKQKFQDDKIPRIANKKSEHMTNDIHKSKSNHIVIYSTNAAGLTYGKMDSFYNFIELHNPNVICIQETHHKRKGILKMKNFTIFEAIKNKK